MTYPPLAILVFALLFLAAGCSQTRATSASEPSPEAQLAVADLAEGVETDSPEAQQAAPTPEPEVLPSFPAHAPVIGTAAARATLRYGRNQVDLVNLSKLPWTGGRVWLNRQWSAALPHTEAGEIRRFDFSYFRDAEGRPFPTDNPATRIERVELQMGDELTRVRYGLGL